MAEKPKVILHWLDKSRSQRILWLIYELGIPQSCDFSVKTYKRTKQSLAPKELKEVHPLGKSPVVELIVPGSTKPIVLAESGAIVEYLVQHFGPQMIPAKYPAGKEGQLGAETDAWLRHNQVMHYTEGSLMFFLVLGVVVENIKTGPQTPYLARPITRIIGGKIEDTYLAPNYESHFNFVEQLLATAPDNGPFFCGPTPTGADFMMNFPLAALSARGMVPKEKFPNIARFVEACEQRQAYKDAVQRIVDEVGEYKITL